MNNCRLIKNIKIEKGSVLLNNTPFFTEEAHETGPFLKALYKHLGIQYGKFFKMDYLSKLGFLAAEIILNDTPEINKETDELALIFANRSSSLYTDCNYQKSIADIPSPAVFVYTLPNIAIGEISIRHKLYGEHMFFIQEEYKQDVLLKYAENLFETTQTKYALLGWLEVDPEGNYKADLMLCGKEQ